MTGKANSVREALIAELLGDVGTLLDRLNEAKATIQTSEKNTASVIEALNSATDRYKAAVSEYTAAARESLSEAFEARYEEAKNITASTTDEMRGIIQETARIAFRSEVFEQASILAKSLKDATDGLKQSRFKHLAEVFLAGISGALLAVWFLSRF